jgi:hypothetical protein
LLDYPDIFILLYQVQFDVNNFFVHIKI